MSTRKCCVRGCNKTRADEILHRFPNPDTELQRFKDWVKVIGGDILFLDNNVVYQQYKICRLHFDPKYHSVSGRLTRNAIPKLLLSGIPSLQRQPLQDMTNKTYSRGSHNQGPHTVYPSNSGQPIPTFPDSGPFMHNNPVASTSKQIISSTIQESTPSISKRQNNRKYIPREIALLENKIKKLQNSKMSITNKLKNALKLSENPTYQKALKKFSTAATIFTMMQFREVGKIAMGRRFKRREKIMALALYKQGPRAYRWLRRFFVLPSPLTLSRMIARAQIRPGVNENIFNHLKKRIAKMSCTEKLCTLLFDEMALTPHFDYSKRYDDICGFVHNGQMKSQEIADHALVFMVRGIYKNYKQPLAYSFSSGTTPKIDLALQIKDLIRKLSSIGFIVIATICDQGTTNVSAINWLINETRQEYLRKGEELKHQVFEIDGGEIIPLYDTPHLIKGIRNNLLKKNLIATFNGKKIVAKWEHISMLYDENPAYQGIRLMPKLTERHVLQNKIPKMKVKFATQVFSRTVAANMGYLANNGILPKECTETADIILIIDELFDSLNGSYENFKKRSGKTLLGPVTPQSRHKKIWTESKKVLRTMKFVDGNGKSASVPTIKNWLQTIDNIEYLVNVLMKKYNLTSLWMRHFNQDPLENFFGCIRSHGYRNNSPSCAGFEAAFASLLINNLSSVHSPGSNCEVDKCTIFKSLNKMFFHKHEMSSYTMEIDYDYIINDNIFVDIEEKRKNPKIRVQLEYVTGYVLKNINKKKCLICKQCLYCNDNDSHIKIREYFANKRCLTYPSLALIKCFSNVQDVVTHTLQKDPNKHNIKQYMKTVLSIVMDYSFIGCNEHKDEIIKKMEDISINLFIFNWCKDTNKLLNGSRSDFDNNSRVQLLAYNYYLKRKK